MFVRCTRRQSPELPVHAAVLELGTGQSGVSQGSERL